MTEEQTATQALDAWIEELKEEIAKNPKALPWLALGQNVQFVLDNTIYDIYE